MAFSTAEVLELSISTDFDISEELFVYDCKGLNLQDIDLKIYSSDRHEKRE
ncbi:hypothetical protein [Acinetobacter sp. ACNIH2]|uniref:hypothetical protein n=1 Tax=Acinetobacter sp. ACNIH2 TaxID=1758189 RepID=UPI0013159571|nr:hypothetical protein [Acinetobacter sp. ACNIH2]